MGPAPFVDRRCPKDSFGALRWSIPYRGHGRAPGLCNTRAVPLLQLFSSKEYVPWFWTSASNVCEAITGLSFANLARLSRAICLVWNIKHQGCVSGMPVFRRKCIARHRQSQFEASVTCFFAPSAKPQITHGAWLIG